ncbi:hypothetical protein N0V90_002352 [Kalmusia sp. IMI 367209]|nr:hypothetical protein N0V90_002352 [Kalmusia sp. IMI 367209]
MSLIDVPISLTAIHDRLTHFESEDDVYNNSFISGGYIIIQQPCNRARETLPTDVKEYLSARSTKLLELNESLSEGPYFAVGQCLHQAWRLYPDFLSAFAVVVVPDDESSSNETSKAFQKYRAIQNAAFTDATAAVSVPVPSRLYYTKTDAQPLGNRAYAELYGKQDTTADYIMSLQEKGAVISAFTVNGWYGYHNFDAFRQGYLEKFGKKPYVSPSHTARWAKNAKYTEADRDESLAKIKVFKDWWNEHIWNVDDAGAYTIMIVPQGRPGANYRDRISNSSGGDSGPDTKSYDEIFITSMLGCPQLIVPIGQNPYESEVSGVEEYAPIVTTLIGPSYSDQSLVELASAVLQKAGWPTSILTGRLMFEKGDNERNTAPALKQKL